MAKAGWGVVEQVRMDGGRQVLSSKIGCGGFCGDLVSPIYGVITFTTSRKLLINKVKYALALDLLYLSLLRPRQARYQAAPRPELNAPIILPSLEDCVQSDSAQAMQSIVFFHNSRHKVVREFNAKRTFGMSSGLTVPKSPREPKPTVRSTSVLLESADWHGT